MEFLTSLILDLTLKIGYKLSIATSLAVSQTTVMPLIFSIWSEVSDRVAHYQAHSSSLVLKSLHLRIKKNPQIEGIRVGAQYADDTTVFLKNPESMSVLLDLLEKFDRRSGLKINHAKSEAMWLGKWKSREDTPFNVKWPKDSVFCSRNTLLKLRKG